MKKQILIWEFTGIILISFIGSLLHFTFAWSGNWMPVALLSAVNESVWEHLKIGFWPALLFGLVEYLYIRKNINNFFTAKAIALLTIPVTIIVLYYSYIAVLGHHLLSIDISIFVIAIIIAQLAGCKIMTLRRLPGSFIVIGFAIIILLTVVFSLLTYFPPHMELFRDPLTGGYGIL